MQWLKDFINGFFGYLWDGFLWLVEGIGTFLHWITFTIYDGILTVISAFATAIDFSEVMFNIGAKYAGLPDQLIWIINAVDLPQFFTYIVSGIMIRMILNLLPAAVTRV